MSDSVKTKSTKVQLFALIVAPSPPRLQRGGLTVGRLTRQLKGNLHPGSGVSNSGLFELETQTPNQKRGPFPLY